MIRLFFLVVFALTSCPVGGNEIDLSDLSYKNGLFLSKSTGDPLTGVVRQRYDNGQMELERHFQNGFETGLSRSWYENGKPKMEANFKDDDFDGFARTWNRRGKLTDESCFRKNKKIDVSYCRTGNVPPGFNDPDSSKPSTSEEDNVYIGVNGVLRVSIPKSSNWAGVPYIPKALDNSGDTHYDKVMFSVDDFGEYLVAGARYLPDNATAQMDQDEPEIQLRAISEAALFGWRLDLEELPSVVEESFFDSKHGYTLRRLYLAENGSLIVNVRFDKGTAQAERFDTYIVSLVSRKGNVLVYTFAQNDQSPENAKKLMTNALAFYDGIIVLPPSE